MAQGRVALFPAATFVVLAELLSARCVGFAIGKGPLWMAPWCGFYVVSNLFVRNPLCTVQKRCDNTREDGVDAVVVQQKDLWEWSTRWEGGRGLAGRC